MAKAVEGGSKKKSAIRKLLVPEPLTYKEKKAIDDYYKLTALGRKNMKSGK